MLRIIDPEAQDSWISSFQSERQQIELKDKEIKIKNSKLYDTNVIQGIGVNYQSRMEQVTIYQRHENSIKLLLILSKRIEDMKGYISLLS